MKMNNPLSLFVSKKFEELAEFFEAALSDIKVRSYFFETDIYYLRAYLSFLSPSREEVLVLSVDCKRDRGLLQIDSDVSESEGAILFEGPSVSLLNKDAILSTDLQGWERQFEIFIENAKEGIVQHIKGQALQRLNRPGN